MVSGHIVAAQGTMMMIPKQHSFASSVLLNSQKNGYTSSCLLGPPHLTRPIGHDGVTCHFLHVVILLIILWFYVPDFNLLSKSDNFKTDYETINSYDFWSFKP